MWPDGSPLTEDIQEDRKKSSYFFFSPRKDICTSRKQNHIKKNTEIRIHSWILQYSIVNQMCYFFLLSFKVSKCCEEVRDYVEERSGEDPLVKGIPEDKNPFKELKGGCVIS